MNKIAILLILIAALLWAASGRAEGWSVTLPEHPSLPTKFLTIDKDQQRLLIFGKKSPLRVMADLTCATGQNSGDKHERGDLKTPEGVYFVGRKLSGGLDYELYGDLAFTLNFPNPVDRIKGKTGSGIWIHGRGSPVAPRETKGCVALYLPDLKGIERELEPGTPVAIAKSVSWTPNPDKPDPALDALVTKVKDWARAWERQGDEFFNLYDPKLFSESRRGSFSAFKNHKRQVFAAQDWIHVMANDIRVVPGPGYWVTYFDQYYRTPSLTSQGVKRLYWMKDEKGEFRIVGREWLRRPVTLTGEYLERVRSEIEPLVQGWSLAWRKADLNAYASYYSRDTRQGDRSGLAEIKQYKRELWARAEPESVSIEKLDVDLAPQGAKASFVQRYSAANGYSDYGLKTLVLSPRPDGDWKIISEDWSPL